MCFEVGGNPYEGTLQIGDPIKNHIVDYCDYSTRNDEAAIEFVCSAVRDYLEDLYQGYSQPQ